MARNCRTTKACCCSADFTFWAVRAEDVLVSLDWVRHTEDGEEAPWSDFAYLNELVSNPWRHVGRSDPCPCRSGKKAKKCCLANGEPPA